MPALPNICSALDLDIQEGITSLCVSSPNYSPERSGVGGLGPDTPLTLEAPDQSEVQSETHQPMREENDAWPGEECGGEARVKPHHQDSLKSSSPTTTRHSKCLPGFCSESAINSILYQVSSCHPPYREFTRCPRVRSASRLYNSSLPSARKSEISVTVTGDCDVKCHTCNTLVTRCVTGRDNGDTYLLL